MGSEESGLFRRARELIETSKELVEKTKELLHKPGQAATPWENNKTPEETRLQNSNQKPR